MRQHETTVIFFAFHKQAALFLPPFRTACFHILQMSGIFHKFSFDRPAAIYPNTTGVLLTDSRSCFLSILQSTYDKINVMTDVAASAPLSLSAAAHSGSFSAYIICLSVSPSLLRSTYTGRLRGRAEGRDTSISRAAASSLSGRIPNMAASSKSASRCRSLHHIPSRTLLLSRSSS